MFKSKEKYKENKKIETPKRIYISEEHENLQCPKCGSKNKAKIIYGYAVLDEDLEYNLEIGNVILGGCCIATYVNDNGETVGPYEYRCKDCKKEFHQEII